MTLGTSTKISSKISTIFAWVLGACLLIVPRSPFINVAAGQGSFSQITATLPSDRPFRYDYQSQDHSLNLEFDKTSPDELAAFERYDEKMVKRVVFKDMSPAGTRVKLVLKNRDIKVLVQSYKEPFRIVIDMYDSNYQPTFDLKTNFPLTTPYSDSTSSITGDSSNSSLPDYKNSGKGLMLLKSTPEPLATPSSSPVPAQTTNANQRRLLQPLGKIFLSPQDMQAALAGIPDGQGSMWASYPPYIYRLQTAAYDRRDFTGNNERSNPSLPSLSDALSSSKIMADYAGKMFDLGNENKALVTYNQILQKDPAFFDQDALSLWKLAEIHLGSGNLTLARGYYEVLVSKYPESALAPFSRLRILDVAAIRYIQKNRFKDLSDFVEKLDSIKVWNNGEVSGLIALRRAYWSSPGTEVGNNYALIPRVKRDIYQLLSTQYAGAENPRTAFLISSILINEFCQNDYQWQRSNGLFAEEYFKRFSGPKTEQYQNTLREKLFLKINSTIQNKVAAGNLIDAIEDYENLPKSMQSVRKNAKTGWSLAESYRLLGHLGKSLEFYKNAADAVPEGSIDRFKSEFWVAYISFLESKERSSTNKATSNQNLVKQAQKYDSRMAASWNRLSQVDKDKLAESYKENFEKAVTNSVKLRKPAQIVLGNWTAKLTSKISTSTPQEPGINGIDKSYSPSASALFLLTDLSKLFESLGMLKEKREATLLLKNMKPGDFLDDQSAKNIWAEQLEKLAEEYRKSNQYLDAGKLFGFVGENSENWEKKAETLYKSGLLLFRAGRKQDAINSLQKAADDGNNLFYANLAKERLNQIQ